MNKYNSVFLLTTLSAIFLSLNTYAAKPDRMKWGQKSVTLQPISALLDYEDQPPPSFEILGLRESYHLHNNKLEIEFTLSSEQLINYYIFIKDSSNVVYHDVSGFINNSQKNIILRIEDITTGNYEIIIDAYGNNKKSTMKRYNINID